MSKSLFIVAGEASADMHAAALLKELKKKSPEIMVSGVGGSALVNEGVNLLLNSERLNVVGISDWWDRVGEVLGGYKKVTRYLDCNKPDYAILLDLPDFNLRLARKLKKKGVPVIYYISPQVWAWRKYRIRQIKRDIDLMLVVFPFEKEFYDQQGVPVVFVGHPLLEAIKPKSSFRDQSQIFEAPRVVLLPGSRRSEVKFHGPILNELIALIKKHYPKAEIKVPVARTLSVDFVRQHVHSSEVVFDEKNSHEVISWGDIALVASGTATLETALIGTPFALFYRVSSLSAWVWQNLMSYRGFIGMPNLLHQKEIVKEFFQEGATAERLFEETDKLIKDQTYRQNQVCSLLQCRSKLGDEGANLRAAETIHQFFVEREQNNRSQPNNAVCKS